MYTIDRDLSSTATARLLQRELFLIAITGVLGLAGEVFFYTLVKAGRVVPVLDEILFSFDWQVDPRLSLGEIWEAPISALYGQCSLWMSPVYAVGTCYVVRPLSHLLHRQHFTVRAAAFGAGITLFEGIAGVVYESLLGFAVWTYVDSGAFWGGATSLRILPLWGLIGLFAERLVRELSHPAWHRALRARLGARGADDPPGPRTVATIAEVRGAIPAHCHEIDEAKAWRTLLEQIALAAAGVALILGLRRYLVARGVGEIGVAVAAAPLSWLLGQVYTGILVIGHDCGHNAFSRRAWVNRVVGQITMGWTGLSFEGWRLAHNFHHAHTQVRGLDPDWPEGQLTREELERAPLVKKLYFTLGYGTPVGLVVGIWLGNLRKNLLPLAYPQIRVRPAQARRVYLGTAAALLMTALTAALFYSLGGLWALAFCYVVPVFFGGVSATLLTFLHHTRKGAAVFDEAMWTPALGQVASTYEVRFPRLLERLWRHINVHLPHHVAPRIPCYHLEEASRAIHAKLGDRVNPETPFRFSLLVDAWRSPLLSSQADPGRTPDTQRYVNPYPL